METQTAEDIFFRNTGKTINQEEYSAMIEFARVRVDKVVKEMLEDMKKLEDFDTWKEWKNTD